MLVGRDLINAAGIRAQISQIEKLNTAVNVFKNKYNGIPGDLAVATASQLGFFSNGMTGGSGNGDGNGLLQDNTVGHGGPVSCGEPLVFWRHLSDAQLIDGSLGASLASAGQVPSLQTGAQAGLWYPATKLGGASIAVYSKNGSNYYETTGFAATAIDVYPSCGWNNTVSFSPSQAYIMDSKVDDGLPTSGHITSASTNNAGYWGDANTPGDGCTLAGTPNTYDVGATNTNIINCNLSFKFQ